MAYSPGSGLTMVSLNKEYDNDKISSSIQHQHIVRCFMHRLVQVVVQSRYGNMPSSSDKSPDWEFVTREQALQHVAGGPDSKFHMDMLDNVEITEHFDRVLGDWTLTPGNAFTVQVLIHTADGDMFVMEMWSLVMSEVSSISAMRHSDTSQLYTKLAALLKSVLLASRVTPGYHYSFNQSPTSYVMFYTITTSPPNVQHLGSQSKEYLFPSIHCSEGVYKLEVRTRTNYKRDPTFNCSILHKDMYYSSLASLNEATCNEPPRHSLSDRLINHIGSSPTMDRQYFESRAIQQKNTNRNRDESRGALIREDSKEEKFRRVSFGGVKHNDPSPQFVPCSSLPSRMNTLARTPPHHSSGHNTSPSTISPQPLPKSPPTAIPRASSSSYYSYDGGSPIVPPDIYVVPRVNLPPGDIFASIVHGSNEADESTSSTDSYAGSEDEDEGKEAINQAPPVEPIKSSSSNPGEFVVVDSPEGELSMFYQACKNAPVLFKAPSPIEHVSDDQNLYGTSAGSNKSTNCNTKRIEEFFVDGRKRSNTQQTVDPEELFSHRKNNSFGAEALKDCTEENKPINPLQQRLKQFEDNLGQFNSLVESLHSSTELDAS